MKSTDCSKRRQEELKQHIKLLQEFGCASCGMPCSSKKLRPSLDGGYELFCRDCINEGYRISRMTPQEREKYLDD